MQFDPNSLTLGEMETIEEITGRPIGLLLASLGAGELSSKAMVAFIVVTQRRTNPDFTVDEAKALKLSDLQFVDESPKG
jgi:hypothetical protein